MNILEQLEELERILVPTNGWAYEEQVSGGYRLTRRILKAMRKEMEENKTATSGSLKGGD